MKRLSFRNMQPQNQKGVSPIDALFAMVIAGMIAVAVMQSILTWTQVRTVTADQDAATQQAQGIIAKTSSLDWQSLGFDPSAPAPTSVEGCPSATNLSFRPSLTINGNTYNTVELPAGTPNVDGLNQTSSVEVRGRKYCVQTDITWGNPATASTQPVSTYETKNVTVKVSWQDKNTNRTISVNSTRSPNIGEAIPGDLAQGTNAETTPIKSFAVTNASNDGSSGKICFTSVWNATSDTMNIVSSTTSSLYPATTVATLTSSDNGVEKCVNVSSTATQGFYGLTSNDSAGVKFKSIPQYQFPGSTLGLAGPTSLSWNSFPATGTTTYRVMSSTSSTLSNPTLVTQTTDTMYNVGTVTGTTWYWIESVNSNYVMTAKSNAISVTG